MKNNMMEKRGFTLIELLVVVLIIGILSAIALPQYQRAVEKARVSEVLTNNKAMENALDLYVLENGYPTTEKVYIKDFVELSGGEWDGNDYYTKHFDYWGLCQTGQCILEHHEQDGKYAFRCFKGKVTNNTYTDWHCTCITQQTKMGRFICKSLEGLGWIYSDTEM